MAKITGGELILKCVRVENVKRIIGISDEGYHAIQHKAADYDIRHIAPRHEAAAAHIAQGIFKASGEMSVVLAGGGPGTANVLAGVICARAEGVPMLVITAQRRREVVYPSKVGIFQGNDQYDWFKPITKWNAVVHQWDRIPEIVATAFREAKSGRPGPAQIDVTETVMNEEGDDSRIEILAPHQYRSLTPLEPSGAEIDELVRLIENAENPVVMAGAGVLSATAWDDFKELVELLNCPALTSGAGHTALPDDHPNHLRASTPGHWAARREADVVITFGTCLGEIDLPFDKYWGGNEQKLIQVDIDPRNIGAHRQLYRGVVADAGAAIRKLVAALREAGTAPADGSLAARCRALNRDARSAMLAEIGARFEDGKIHPVQSIQAISEVFPDDAINVADGGNTSLYNRVVRTFTTPRTQLGNFEFGHLGTGIPHAIGAKLAAPEKEVVCISGDGAAGFNIMELETAVREQAKITVVVHAEGSWSMEELVHRSTDVAEDRFGCFLAPTRWDKIAEGVGCHSEYVDRVEDLVPAMRRAREAPQAALVCVKTDRAMNLEPPGSDVFGEVYTGVPDE